MSLNNPDNVTWNIRIACDIIANPPATFHEKTLIAAWQFIIANGFVWQLNDYFQRTATELIMAGVCIPTKHYWGREIPEDFPPEYLPQDKVYKSKVVQDFIKVLTHTREKNYDEWQKNRKKQEHETQESAGEDPGDSDPKH